MRSSLGGGWKCSIGRPMVVRDGMSEQFPSQVHDMGVKNMSMPVTWPKMDLFGIRALLCLGSVE